MVAMIWAPVGVHTDRSVGIGMLAATTANVNSFLITVITAHTDYQH
jgi:hypothetical protein